MDSTNGQWLTLGPTGDVYPNPNPEYDLLAALALAKSELPPLFSLFSNNPEREGPILKQLSQSLTLYGDQFDQFNTDLFQILRNAHRCCIQGTINPAIIAWRLELNEKSELVFHVYWGNTLQALFYSFYYPLLLDDTRFIFGQPSTCGGSHSCPYFRHFDSYDFNLSIQLDIEAGTIEVKNSPLASESEHEDKAVDETRIDSSKQAKIEHKQLLNTYGDLNDRDSFGSLILSWEASWIPVDRSYINEIHKLQKYNKEQSNGYC